MGWIARVSVVSAVAGAVVLLSGCTGSTSTPPVVTITAAPTATASAAPASPTTGATGAATATALPSPDGSSAKSVTLGATGITVTASEGTITTEFSDGVTPTVDALSAVLGAVQPSFLAAGKCNSDQTTYDWGALTLTYLGSDPSADTYFSLRATSAPSAPSTVDIRSTLGARVGDDWAPYLATVPASQPRWDYGTYAAVLESTTPSAASSTVGTVVTAMNGVIGSINTPSDLNADC